MTIDTRAVLTSKMLSAQPKERADIFVEYVNFVHGPDLRDGDDYIEHLLRAIGPAAVSMVIWALPEISDQSRRSIVCSSVMDHLKSYNGTPPVGPIEMMRLMVSTRRISVVRPAFTAWAHMWLTGGGPRMFAPFDSSLSKMWSEHHRSMLRISLDQSTVQMLESAAQKDNHSSAIAAAAALFVCSEKTEHVRLAARRLGAELKSHTETACVQLFPRKDGIIRAADDSTNAMDIATLVLAQSKNRPPAYSYGSKSDRSRLLESAVDTVLLSMGSSMSIEQAKRLLEEFPESWVVASAVAASAEVADIDFDYWPYAVGPRASAKALRGICQMAHEVLRQTSHIFPWHSPDDFHAVSTHLFKSAKEHMTEYDRDGISRILAKMKDRDCGAGVGYLYGAEDIAPLVSFRASDGDLRLQAASDLTMELLDYLYLEPGSLLSDDDMAHLCGMFSEMARSDSLKESMEEGYFDEHDLYRLQANMAAAIGLSGDDMSSQMCIGTAITALPGPTGYPHMTQFSAEVIQAIESCVHKMRPGSDLQSALTMMCEASDRSQTIEEFFDSHRSLFVR